MGAADNKTLRTACTKCGKELPTDVHSDPKQRKTWPLLAETNGRRQVFPTCTDCYNDGWRPVGYVD